MFLICIPIPLSGNMLDPKFQGCDDKVQGERKGVSPGMPVDVLNKALKHFRKDTFGDCTY